MFFIAPSFQNPFRFCVGINMEMLSAFKNESEFLMYNQIIPIKKTETFSDAMELLVSHLLFSLKNRKTRINDAAAFYHKLGVEWNDQWIPIILEHKLLFAETQCKPRNVIDRLFAELNIMDQQLVDRVLDMTSYDGRPYVVYLVEELKVNKLLQHYRLMTSVFTIKRYCQEIGCSWVKWEPNNKMNDELGVSDIDDTCFDDAEYQINDQAASRETYFVADTVRTVKVRQCHFFGDRLISVYGQKSQGPLQDDKTHNRREREDSDEFMGFRRPLRRRRDSDKRDNEHLGADHVPHNFGSLLKVDAYSNLCVVIDDIPSSNHRFEIGQEVKYNNDSYGKISRIKKNGICVKVVNGDMICLRWLDAAKYDEDLTLSLRYIRNLDKYEFTAVKGQEDESQNILSSKNYKFGSIDQFGIPCGKMLKNGSCSHFIGVYVQRKDDTDCKWGRLKLIKYPRNDMLDCDRTLAENMVSPVASTGQLLTMLQRASFEITERTRFLEKCGLELDRCCEWVDDITASSLLFAVSRYRRKLVIERLIVELKLWSTEWIHRILEEKMMDKPMLQWLVEDRKLTKLHDHYRVHKSLHVQSSALMNRRWLRFDKKSKMTGKPGFGRSDDSCFERTQYHADDVPLSPTTAVVTRAVQQITVTNTNLFGSKCIVLHKFEKEQDDYISDDFADALQFDGEVISINPIPSATYPFCVGQEVQSDVGWTGRISQMTEEAVCVKFVAENMSFFRWIERDDITMDFILTFRHRDELQKYQFVVTVGEKDSKHIAKVDKYRCSDIEKFEISCTTLKLHDGDAVCVYAQPRTGGHDWVCLKQIKYGPDSCNDIGLPSLVDHERNYGVAVNNFVRWLRQSSNKVDDAIGVLSHFGLELSLRSEWMPFIANHPRLCSITAYRRQQVIERLLIDFDFWSHDLLYRMVGMKKQGEPMISWLFQNLFVKRLYDVGRAILAGFQLIHRSELLNKTWLEFDRYEKVPEIVDIFGVEFANDSCLDKTTYLLDDVTYPMNTSTTTLCVTGIPRQICRNEALFGDYDINTFLMSFNHKTKPIWNVSMCAPRDHLSWFSNNVAPRKRFPLKLSVLKHRHRRDDKAKNLLEHGTSTGYHTDIGNWIVFEQLTLHAVPTMIAILNDGDEDDALKSMKIFGSADEEVYEEWVHIDDLLCTNDKPQHFELDPESIHFAWSRRFRYFRVCSMQNYAGGNAHFYEFSVHGISLKYDRDVDSTESMNFIDALKLDKDSRIVTRPAIDVHFGPARKLELQNNGEWIDVKVSRVHDDKISVKWSDDELMSYQWIQSDEIPTKLRFDINFREQMSDLIFSVAVGADKTMDSLPHSKQISFKSEEEFVIPLNEMTVHSNIADTAYLYAKPKRKQDKFEFEEIKRFKCGKELFSSFAVHDSFFVDCSFEVKSAIDSSKIGGKFEVFAMSDIVIQKSGTVEVSCCESEGSSKSNCAIMDFGEFVGDTNVKGGFICLISGANVVNEGHLRCGNSNAKVVDGGVVYIDTDGVFENKGIIKCGEDGFVHIKCSEFKNDGVIIPNPKVTYKDTKDNQKAIEQVTSTGESQSIKFRISDHKGHRSSDEHPRNLLDRGCRRGYGSPSHSNDKTSANDWITFRNQKDSRTYPMTIEITNFEGDSGLKTLTIEGSANGIRFDDWVKIEDISNLHEDLQTFTVGPLAGYFAWERAFMYFKLNILENHGGRYNRFYEFKINGRDEK